MGEAGILGFKQGPLPVLGAREWNASFVLICLIESMLSSPIFVNFPQTLSLDGTRKFDLLSLKIDRNQNNALERCVVIGFEIKCSRGDFLSELSQPDKYIHCVNHCDEFYFVAPKGLIHTNELPPGTGLIEVYQEERPELIGFWRHAIVRSSDRNGSPDLRSTLGVVGRKAGDAKYRKGFCALMTYFRPSSRNEPWLPSYQVGTIDLPNRMQWSPRLATDLNSSLNTLVATMTDRRVYGLLHRAYLNRGAELLVFSNAEEHLARYMQRVQIVWDDEHLLSLIDGLDWNLICGLFAEFRRRGIPELSITQIGLRLKPQ
jgi:hypothetical protein